MQLIIGKETVLIDDADRELIASKNIKIRHNKPDYPVVFANGKVLARLLLEAPDDQEVDHKNGDSLDNRRENLRFCTRSQNCQNRRRHSNNRSGFKGVYFDPQNCNRWTTGRWIAQIRVNGKKIRRIAHSKEEAARIYDDLARRFHGEFARTNSDI